MSLSLMTQGELPVVSWVFLAGLMSMLLLLLFPLFCCCLAGSEDTGQFLSTIEMVLLQDTLISSFIPVASKTIFSALLFS